VGRVMVGACCCLWFMHKSVSCAVRNRIIVLVSGFPVCFTIAMASLGPAVKKLRSALGLTQPAFAKRVGLSVRAIANYEKDREPSGEILQRFAGLAARHNLDGLAKIFYDAFADEIRGRTIPSTAEETAYTRAMLLLLRHRSVFSGWTKVSGEVVAALESLVEEARKAPTLKAAAALVKMEEALVELRYHAAPNAEQRIHELARVRSGETGEVFEQAYAHVVYERPDLYEEYLEDRAAAAKGTSLEASMHRPRRAVAKPRKS
jgi:transcriptional regulator with XRE-family HTH domain